MARHCLRAIKLVVELWEVCIAPSVWGLIVKNEINLGGHSKRFRVERNPVLCGHLNGDVGIFVVLNFGNKSCVLCAHIALHSKFMFMFLLS
jgi:hypothetical protein